MLNLWNKKFKYHHLTRGKDSSGSRFYSLDGKKVPSVTTILDKTKSQREIDALNDWKTRVGLKEANRISKESMTRGDKMHKYLEDALHGKQSLDFDIMTDTEKEMSETVIAEGLNNNLTEIWGCEVPLYYPESHAGTSDLCGIYDSQESIIDFKTSTRIKKREWITDYFIQTAAYALAHNYQHGTNITQGVILMCTPDLKFEKFIVKDNEFTWYQKKFIDRLNSYNTKYNSYV